MHEAFCQRFVFQEYGVRSGALCIRRYDNVWCFRNAGSDQWLCASGALTTFRVSGMRGPIRRFVREGEEIFAEAQRQRPQSAPLARDRYGAGFGAGVYRGGAVSRPDSAASGRDTRPVSAGQARKDGVTGVVSGNRPTSANGNDRPVSAGRTTDGAELRLQSRSRPVSAGWARQDAAVSKMVSKGIPAIVGGVREEGNSTRSSRSRPFSADPDRRSEAMGDSRSADMRHIDTRQHIWKSDSHKRPRQIHGMRPASAGGSDRSFSAGPYEREGSRSLSAGPRDKSCGFERVHAREGEFSNASEGEDGQLGVQEDLSSEDAVWGHKRQWVCRDRGALTPDEVSEFTKSCGRSFVLPHSHCLFRTSLSLSLLIASISCVCACLHTCLHAQAAF